MRETEAPRFTLTRISPTEWLIHDLQHAENDPRHVVACVHEDSDVSVEVIWLREVPLMTHYMSPEDVVEELGRLHCGGRHSAPIPIVHLAPPPASD